MNIEFAFDDEAPQNEIATVDGALVEIKSRFEMHKIETDADLSVAGSLLKEVRDYVKRIEDVRQRLVKPLNDHVKNINADFKPRTEAAKEIETGIVRAMKQYNDAQQAKREADAKAARDAETARLREEAERLAAAAVDLKSDRVLDTAVKVEAKAAKLDAAPVRVQQTFGNDTAKTTFRKVWRFEIIDREAVPREYLEVSEPKVKMAVTAGAREIPGIRIFEDSTIATR